MFNCRKGLIMNKILLVTIKNVYGTEMIYPANDAAHIFANIARQKTLSRETLKNAKALGYDVQVMQPTLELA